MGEWQNIEVYSTFLRIRGQVEVLPGQRLSDVVNRLNEFLELHNTITDPLTAGYPVVTEEESNTTIAKRSVVMVCPETEQSASANRMLWREKIHQHVVLNTTAFALEADVHLEPRSSLLQQLEYRLGDFLPVTRVSAVWVPSLGAQQQVLRRDFALINPASIVSFSLRDASAAQTTPEAQQTAT